MKIFQITVVVCSATPFNIALSTHCNTPSPIPGKIAVSQKCSEGEGRRRGGVGEKGKGRGRVKCERLGVDPLTKTTKWFFDETPTRVIVCPK